FDGDTVFYQGTVLIACDLVAAMEPLTLSERKRTKHGIREVAERMTTLATLLGDQVPDAEAVAAALLEGFAARLDLGPQPGPVTAQEEKLAQRCYDEEIGSDEFVAGVRPLTGAMIAMGERTLPGGTLRVQLQLDGRMPATVTRALFTGDFFVTPPRVIYDLEAALKGVRSGDAPAAAARFLGEARVEILSVAPEEFARLVAEAVKDVTGEVGSAWQRS
ncbi:MAG TPA: hypothetical protein VLW75_09940, partial [Rhizomicrobium sp.]|nr:hypothetical protein [Rhizomicrobium sp.]